MASASRAAEFLATGALNVDNQNKAWRDDTSSFGFKMMQKMGWSQGKGLGKDETGMNMHLKAGRRKHGLGLGATAVEGTNNTPWLETAGNFASLLTQLQAQGHTTAQSKRAQQEEDDSSGSDSDDDGAAAEAAKQPKKRKGSKAIYKPTKRLKAKDASGYSAEDLASILGVAPGASTAGTNAFAPAVVPELPPSRTERKAAKKAKKAKKEKKEKKAKKAKKSKRNAGSRDAEVKAKKKKTKKKKEKASTS